MPNITLEYSSNLMEIDSFSDFFAQCHKILAKDLPTDLINCKSRAISYSTYYIGDGQPKHAFIHLQIKIQPGRQPEIIQNVGKKIFKLLKKHFKKLIENFNLQLSLEIIEVGKYFKKSS